MSLHQVIAQSRSFGIVVFEAGTEDSMGFEVNRRVAGHTIELFEKTCQYRWNLGGESGCWKQHISATRFF